MSTTYRNPIGYGVNVDHAPMLLRLDLLEHLAFLKQYCGFEFLRSHGIFDDSIHVASKPGDGSQPDPVWAIVDGGAGMGAAAAKDEVRYHFQQAIKVYENTLAVGYTPMVELSFLPRVLAAEPKHRCCHYAAHCSQPTSYEAWGELVERFARALVNRFGLSEVARWRFTVWNEPNGGFWSPDGDKFEGYMKLYEAAARALKRVSKRLEVGGPATMIAGWAPPDTDMGKASPLGRGGPSEGQGWLENFIDRCKAGRIPVDFIETHLYPHDEYEIYREKAREQYPLGEFFPGTIRKNNRIVAERLPGADVVWGEWASNHRPMKEGVDPWDPKLSRLAFNENELYDTPMGGAYAALIAGTFLTGEKFCWWVGSDVYHEWGLRHEPYQCGYGLMTIYGIPKPSAHAHHFAHRMDGGKIIANASRGGAGFLTVKKGRENLLMCWNFIRPELPKTKYVMDLSQAGVRVGKGATIELVDDSNANGFAAWNKLGKPAELSPAQEKKIRSAAALSPRKLTARELARQQITLEPNAFALVVSK